MRCAKVATCHLSLEMARLCQKYGIQPILLRPNTTHLTEALDLTFFASLKAGLKEAQELWHRDPANIGCSLSKYQVVTLVHKVTECILQEKPQLIGKGFRKAPSMLYVDEDEGLREAGQEFLGGEEAGLVQEHAEEARNTPTSSPFQPADSRFCANLNFCYPGRNYSSVRRSGSLKKHMTTPSTGPGRY